MELRTATEIHFHQQDEASVYLENNGVGEQAEFLEILTFCCLASRQMSNLGFSGDRRGVAKSLAFALQLVPQVIDDIATSGLSDGPRLVDYRGTPGRKRFLASLKGAENQWKFKMDAKGFGILAQGIDYYAPNSVLLFLHYLSKRRLDDEHYTRRLSQAAFHAGQAYLDGKIGVATQVPVALAITAKVFETTSLENRLSMAQRGDAESQAYLGLACEKGLGAPQNYSEALKWYRLAADQGHVLGEWGLGILYANGTGVEQDNVEAFKWIRRAADRGYARAQSVLAMMYAEGRGIPQDHSQAAKWAHKAADQGDTEAQFGLGLMYAKGYGVSQDRDEAVKWIRKAAEQGHEQARRILGGHEQESGR